MTTIQLITKRSELISVCEQCPERAYLQLEVPDTIARIQSLTFTIVSHDQGWSDVQDLFRGSYEHVFSYFEAYITTPTGHDRARPRTLQSNRHAVPEPFKHVIRWDSESSLEVRTWLGCIRGGDFIQVVPQAHHQGWKNYVYEMQIEATGIENPEPQSATSMTLISPISPISGGYKVLDGTKSEIRLLNLLPGKDDEPLRCEMLHTSLTLARIPSYETISYCWGSAHEQDEISVLRYDDEPEPRPSEPRFVVYIRSNLSHALRRLRASQGGQSRMLWVDAICIDQNNLSERATQVSLMKQIYTRATRTIVWLGEEESESAGAGAADNNNREVSNLLLAAEIARNYSSANGWEYSDPQPLHAPLKVPPDQFSGSDCPIFERPWFRRSWVVQEVVYAAAVTVQVGAHAVPWPLLLRMNRCVSRAAWRPASIRRALMPALFNILFEADGCTGNLFLMGETNPRTQRQVDVLDVVVQGADLDATDPRDKIFALVGLDLAGKGDGGRDERVRPDYTKGIGRVFADFTRWWVVTHRSLRILSAVHVSVGRTWQKMSLDTVRAEGRTSWSFWSDGKSVWSRSTLGLWRSSRYRASANTVVDVELVDEETDFSRLRLKGCRISRIAAVRKFPYFRCLTTKELVPLRRVYEKLLEPTNSHKTWTPEASLHDLDADHNVELTTDDWAISSHLQTHRQYAVEHDGAIECHPAVFFTTEDGIQGLCPPMALPGDIVVVLYGGNVPYILRELSISNEPGVEQDDLQKRYSLIGECFLERYMFGLGIQQIRDASHPRSEEIFDIF